MGQDVEGNTSYKKNIHFGSGEEGRSVLMFVRNQAKDRGLTNVHGEPNINGYLVWLIKEEMKRKKVKVP